MAHLVQPILVDGDYYCIIHGSTSHTGNHYRTVSFPTLGSYLAGMEDGDLWILTDESNLLGQVEFYTCCIQTIDITIDFTVDTTSAKGTVGLYINGVLYELVDNSAGTLTTYTISVDLSTEGIIDRPCGNSFLLAGNQDDDTTGAIAVSVSDVT